MQRWTAIVADDDSASADLIKESLGHLPYDVVGVSTPNAIVAAAKANKRALVLAAASLPELDARRLCKELHAEPGYAYVIILLDEYAVETVTTAFAAGADDVIAKPLIAGEVAARLHHAMHVLTLEDFRGALEGEGSLLAEITSRASFHSRRYLQAQLANELARARRFAHALALIIIELRCTHGNERVMRTCGQLLSDFFRSRVDWIARYGRQSFALVLPETDLVGALRAAARVKTQLLSNEFPLRATGLPNAKWTVNLGVSAIDEDSIAELASEDPQVLLDAAEAYLLDATHKGPSQIAGGPAPHA